ncbi:sigma-70 family RNA polymerase sigma factor [uncultured Sphingomonas sp.]|uniref:sigma-70 family RNA polymerase sigma factor n=1 Tax=uncultured Sphingomonas sp. TaxID=158754 RepID=UPI0025F3AE1E|nr:sigma-70 family RNA polymerase sigma factor [uncultured Sphingomonas sp.]
MSGSSTTALTDEEFKDQLQKVIPHLRAFGRGLCGNRDTTDDLVQETMLKAWSARSRFQAGTNFKAWAFTILRNLYFSQTRRKRFVGEWNDLVADRVLAAPASQDKTVELRDLMRALQQLTPDQREAIILVAAAGMSYEEVAEVTGVMLGTVKSRVSRARLALETLMNEGILNTKRQDFDSTEGAVISLLASLKAIQARHAPKPCPAAAAPLPIAA